jgi:membrane protein
VATIDLLRQAQDFFDRELWREDLTAIPRPRRYLYASLRLLYVLLREVYTGQLALWAMSLVYTTLLSLVPLLAVSFALLKGFGAHTQMEPLLQNLLAPLGPQGVEVTERIVTFVGNMQVTVLGWVGMVFLIYTVISLIQKIEQAFNFVWRVKSERSFARRFSDYLSVIIVGPLLVFSAVGLTASVMNYSVVRTLLEMEPFGTLMVALSRLMPFFLIAAAFAFIYMFVPNTRVRFRSALVGGLVGGALWQLTGYAFASFAAGSTRYDAIYSSFAILILFMIWLYLSWFILLFGAKVAYYHQHPTQVRREAERFTFSNRLKERVGLVIMYLITRAYERGEKGWSLDALTQRVGLPGEALGQLMVEMGQYGFVAETSDDPPIYLPGRDPSRLTVRDILAGLRATGESGYPLDPRGLSFAPVDQVFGVMDQAVADSLGEMTLEELAARDEQGR